MTKQMDSSLAQIELSPAGRDEEPILANLLELYIHDFSEFKNIEIDANGRFGYPNLSSYWREPEHHPFLVRENGKLAGLVLVTRETEICGDEPVWDMAEFFILRGYRRRGIGATIAHQVWKQFPGRWRVRVMESNAQALRFWERAVSTFRGEAVNGVQVELGGSLWKFFLFES